MDNLDEMNHFDNSEEEYDEPILEETIVKNENLKKERYKE